MTTLSSFNLATTLAPTRLTNSVNHAMVVDGDAKRMVALSPSAIVTIPSASGITVLNLNAGRHPERRHADGELGRPTTATR
ncbi:hypothetical protein [Paraburkholderia caledonica]|uniref:Uncharacterized protein n=1 Tax=Paraburkholderia caledonica TaxID=134536 RepID=A0AB73IQY3_9BURK|nr:hypothetical protein [Paraburkholderia caledonica]